MSELNDHEDLILAELKRINSRLLSLISAVDTLNDRLADFARTLHMRNLAMESARKRQEQQQVISLDQLREAINANPLLKQLLNITNATQQQSIKNISSIDGEAGNEASAGT